VPDRQIPPTDPPRLPGTVVSFDHKGRRRGVRRPPAGMLTATQAAHLVGVDPLTIRLWCARLGIGLRFEPGRFAPWFVYPHLAVVIAALRDARGALPRDALDPNSPRYKVLKQAMLTAIRAKGEPLPETTIAALRIRLGLPPYPNRRIPPPASVQRVGEVRHASD
jgi:hypothetical protein